MLNKMCDIYETNVNYILHCYAIDSHGLNIACEPVCHIPLDANANDLLAKIQLILASSGKAIKIPDTIKHDKKLLKLIGFRSWQALRKSSHLCTFELENGFYIITPNNKKGKGYMGKKNETINISINRKPEEIISQLKNAFALCN
jgi:hypothetical protein